MTIVMISLLLNMDQLYQHDARIVSFYSFFSHGIVDTILNLCKLLLEGTNFDMIM